MAEFEAKLKKTEGVHEKLVAINDADDYQPKVCMAKGTKLGRTQAFITAVYCEMLRAYTVRCAPGDGMNPPWMWEVFNRNKYMHIACNISFWSTLAVTLIPVVNTKAFHVLPLSFYGYLIGIAFP